MQFLLQGFFVAGSLFDLFKDGLLLPATVESFVLDHLIHYVMAEVYEPLVRRMVVLDRIGVLERLYLVNVGCIPVHSKDACLIGLLAYILLSNDFELAVGNHDLVYERLLVVEESHVCA